MMFGHAKRQRVARTVDGHGSVAVVPSMMTIEVRRGAPRRRAPYSSLIVHWFSIAVAR
jgi:hypothetical protein